ncbi:Re/Si-specific NAD(P)(+) transhydrogenase subunit alpha [Candidatus Tokpelaia sp.]|uniref:Re/Si-specific NAD(P)(+) transhydrogenase subunit alpha n=1 Tax=Candidatus Tokpelaia sp. TaxID=2233777 RepID=UPI001239BB93|nr:Re/Si-specific NAD(P)(+) transhydrogenase subunit alpha [Candidatus Tokpelaia sp.]KAA6406264.1 Re/Si-specific NAD(P)(+) transhydrogenase subunit alpha [Candidatus Tokpelaia sp.]
MALSVFVAKESFAGEKRVAASPETIRKYKMLGFAPMVERGAGQAAAQPDAAFAAAGAEIVEREEAAKADIVLKLRRPTLQEAEFYKKGAYCLCLLDPYGHNAETELAALAATGLRAFSMELMPRITRAQSMDVLSSQANLAGYCAVIEAAAHYGRLLPMMMTAAGTVPAARVFVMGAGVAGLSAIATARRLGAVVTATDVRPAAKEQVASLGAKFIAVEDEEFRAAETAGGYAREMSADYQQRQAALIAGHIAKQDIIITTALIPSRPAPRLVSAAMIKSMRAGSVLVDLAVERGGNIEGVAADDIIEIDGVKLIGWQNMPGRVAATASELYARNLYAFIAQFTDKESGIFAPDSNDELVKASLLMAEGCLLPVIPAFAYLSKGDKAAVKPEKTAEESDEAAAKAVVNNAAEGEESDKAESVNLEPRI